MGCRAVSAWISLKDAVQIVETALGPDRALQRLAHRIMGDQIALRVQSMQLWDDDGRHKPASHLDGVMFARIAIKTLAISEDGEWPDVVDHVDPHAGDMTIQIGDTLCVIFGLKLSRDDMLSSFEISPTNAKRTLTAERLETWISECGFDNSAKAYRALRAEIGSATPKRDDVFMEAWRKVKGHRPRGRLRKSPD